MGDFFFNVPSKRPKAATIGFVAALVVFVVWAAIWISAIAWLAIIPTFVATALAISAPGAIVGRVRADGIRLRTPPIWIPFSSIVALETPDGPDPPGEGPFAIRIHHDRGVIDLPASAEIDAAGIFETLSAQHAPGGSRNVHPLLHPFLLEQIQLFGPDRVTSFCAAQTLRVGDVHKPRTGLAVWIALVFAFFCLAVAPIDSVENPTSSALISRIASVGLIACLGIWPLLYAVQWAGGRYHRSHAMRWASVVISPVGLAMVQGDLCGRMPWEELLDVKLKGAPGRGVRSSRASGRLAIHLVVEGATIVIPDVYDRLIQVIHDRIIDYWRPQPAAVRRPSDACHASAVGPP